MAMITMMTTLLVLILFVAPQGRLVLIVFNSFVAPQGYLPLLLAASACATPTANFPRVRIPAQFPLFL